MGPGQMAVLGRIEKRSSTGWIICKSGPYTTNSSTATIIYSNSSALGLGCGSGEYRLRSENRITYAGVSYSSPPYVSPSVSL